ncbi:MAG TPA: polyphosphate kinase [Saprospiraceae bacterium]|nr:polyphosphate kinase [Saprospiraceae bacterium]
MKINLSHIPTTPPDKLSRKDAEEATKDYAKTIGELHYRLLAQKKYNLLVIFQGMDASGKDGAVKNVFKECTHNGIRVYSFKKPTEEEFAHDFLWRVHKQVPQKGEIVIFNRSHYEDILIQWVHGWIDNKRRTMRMKAINNFESLLAQDNQTIILKFYLHLSKDEQKVQLTQRIDDPTKRWKHNDNDWKERAYWDKYMKAYEYALNHSQLPWHIIPVDKRWYRDYLVSKILAKTLEDLDLTLPFEHDDHFKPNI